jgi:hypothetical protein
MKNLLGWIRVNESKLSVRRAITLTANNTVRGYWISPSEKEQHPFSLLDFQHFAIKIIFVNRF